MFGIKLWYSPGDDGCYRCGRKDLLLASPGWFSFQLWCSQCLWETGRWW